MAEQLLGSPDEPLDIYVDSVRIAFGPYGFVLELGTTGLADTPASERPPVRRNALVRMSPQHALILSRLLERNVAKYQEKVGKINLPAELYEELKIDPE
jgi:hypothetical protein